MKYMKLGSKPDAFQADGNNVRYVASELPTDIIVSVDEVKFYLHKFPLISNSKRLCNLIIRASEERTDEVHIEDFPGGSKAFEICAKFCYGMTVTLNAYNVVAVRCAAEYLEMTDDIEKGNLIYKIEVFLNSSILCSWKDSIIVLQATKSFLPWSEDLKIAGRCIDSIASKTSVEPPNVNWSYTYSKKLASTNQIVEEGTMFQQKMQPAVPKDWWIEDICDLDVDLYKRVMIAVKAKGRMSADVIGEALRIYTIRWLPDSVEGLLSEDYARRNRYLVETIIWLLPSDKGSGRSCSFLLKLLKVVTLIGIEDSLKEELLDRISQQLDKASVKDLLIPAGSEDGMVYDVHLVQDLVGRFMMHGAMNSDYLVKDDDDRDDGFVLQHASVLAVGKLVDGYLAEIAHDTDLPVSSFIDLSRSLPETARPIHDGLYKVIDIYLKEHPGLTKAEKKRLCGLMDVKKLCTDACVHAAQNERLPLRVVVQVLYFEQVRATTGGSTLSNDIPHGSARSATHVEGDWEKPEENYKSLKTKLESNKLAEDPCSAKDKNSKNRGGGFLLSSRSRRIFDKLWVGKAQVENNRSSETSRSSQSPPPASVNLGDAKSSGSSRNRRHSVS